MVNACGECWERALDLYWGVTSTESLKDISVKNPEISHFSSSKLIHKDKRIIGIDKNKQDLSDVNGILIMHL